MKKKKNPHFLAPKEADFSPFFEREKAFLDGVEIKVLSFEENKTPLQQPLNTSFLYEDMKIQIFPLDASLNKPFLKPIETRAYKDIQVTRCQTKEGLSVLSVEGQDGVTMCVPGSFDGLPQKEEKSPIQPQVSQKQVPLPPQQNDLMQKSNAFQSKIKEAKLASPQIPPKAPYNLADVPPITYGKPRKEGVNLLRVFNRRHD